MPLRQREEVQKMLRRCLILAALCGMSLSASVWKDRPAKSVSVSVDQAVWKEYGFEEAAAASFGRYRVAAYRFDDTTGSFAASQWLGGLNAGNYVLVCSGKCPKTAELQKMTSHLADFSGRPGPSLQYHLPKNPVPRSERYILGPASLAKFAPGFRAEDAAFQFSTEGEVAKYHAVGSELTLALFSFPTPQMARQQAVAFQKMPGAKVKRTGPLVAVIPAPSDLPEAARLLDQVKYQASVTIDEAPRPGPKQSQNVGAMILSIFMLAGIILVFCLLAGLAYGGLRILRRRFGKENADEGMILLHLSDE